MKTNSIDVSIKTVLLLSVLMIHISTIHAQLLPTSNKKTAAKPVAKSVSKGSSKSNGTVTTEKPASKTEANEKSTGEPEDQMITFATLEELKGYKDTKEFKKWKSEKKILLYNLYKNKQLETIKDMDEFWSKSIEAYQSSPQTYKNAAEQWDKSLFNNASYIQYTNIDAINQLRSSLDGMKSMYKSLSESLSKNKEIYISNTIIQDIKSYYELMFDNPVSSKELSELKIQENLLVKVGNDVQTLSTIASSMNESLTKMISGLDALEMKVNARSENKSNSLASNFSNLFKGITGKDDVPKAGIISMKDVVSKEAASFRNSDLLQIKNIVNGNFNEPQKGLGNHTPLVFALATRCDLKIVKYIIDGGADLNRSTYQMSSLFYKFNVSPLILFCSGYDDNKYENITFLQTMLDKGAKPYSSTDSKTIKKEAALFLQMLRGRKLYLQALKQRGYDIAGDAK